MLEYFQQKSTSTPSKRYDGIGGLQTDTKMEPEVVKNTKIEMDEKIKQHTLSDKSHDNKQVVAENLQTRLT